MHMPKEVLRDFSADRWFNGNGEHGFPAEIEVYVIAFGCHNRRKCANVVLR